jgi:4'-phosphopantetheinyl transferase EntD
MAGADRARPRVSRRIVFSVTGTHVTIPPTGRPLIAAILPPDVVVAESDGDLSDAVLFPEEAALIDRAVNKRRREFAAGRCLARRALGQLGVAPAPILIGAHREPCWPEGIVGSITHCAGYCGAVVAHADAFAAIGIDAEVHAPLPDGVLDLVTRAEEREWMRAHERAGEAICWDRLWFSAKESVFKAWFPLTGQWLDFLDVRLRVDREAATFHAAFVTHRVDVGGRVMSGFDGRYLVRGGHVLTSVAIFRHIVS